MKECDDPCSHPCCPWHPNGFYRFGTRQAVEIDKQDLYDLETAITHDRGKFPRNVEEIVRKLVRQRIRRS